MTSGVNCQKNMKKDANNFLLQDIAIIVTSVVLALLLAQTDALIKILTSTQELEFLGSFIAGMFFTSIFTTAPAIVTLGEIAQVNTLVGTALFGAVGAVIGDLVIFRFIRDRFSGHLIALLKHSGGRHRFRALFKLKFFRWFTFLLGGLIIASPLPDELGISLLGFSKMKLRLFIPVSFIFNFLGIILIGLVARAL